MRFFIFLIFLGAMVLSCSSERSKDNPEEYFIDDWMIVESLEVSDIDNVVLRERIDTLMISFYRDGTARGVRLSSGTLKEYIWSYLSGANYLYWVVPFDSSSPGLSINGRFVFHLNNGVCLDSQFGGLSRETYAFGNDKILEELRWDAYRVK